MDIMIESPRGGSEKYIYDKNLGFFRLKKVLAYGLVFPFDFGYIPGSKGMDGDPLDVMVISELHGFPGCIMDCRIIGCITALQGAGDQQISNDRYLAIPYQSRQYEKVLSVEDLPYQLITDIENFFLNYTRAEGKVFKITGKLSAAQAINCLLPNG